MATYSFADVNASIDGPNGSISLGQGAGNAEEGISLSYTDDRNNMMVGADGNGMQTLRMDKSGTITVRLLKTSPVNSQLETMMTTQSLDSAIWGVNVITVGNTKSGDLWSAYECAFARIPDYNYQQDGDTVEWQFQAVSMYPSLGEY